MGEFIQTMKDWRRMCKAFTTDDAEFCCDGCPIVALEIDKHGCDAIFSEWADKADWEEVEDVIETWAAEHPEPRYPTWVEWLHTTSAVDGTLDIPVGDGSIFRMAIKNDPIPANIAEKLGLQPKEGTC